jgi:hypothetical protein
MGKPKLDKTESTFSKNDISIRREYSTRRDTDNVRKISVTIYDIDHAIKWFIQNAIRPTIEEDENLINVPVMFTTGEKWAQAQRSGYLRDKNNMISSPLIMLRRTSMEPRTDLENNNVLRGISYNTGNKILFERKYTAANRYDRFSLYNQVAPLREFYAVDFPKFVTVNYDLLIWTNGMEHLNEICEQFIYFDGKAWGDTFKFITYTDTPSFELINDIGSDRLVRAAFSLRTQGHLIPDRTGNDSGLEKFYGVTKTMVATETEVDPEQLDETFAERQARVMNLISNASKDDISTQDVNTDVNRNILIPPTGQTNEPPAPVVVPGTNVQWPRPDSLI